MAVENDDFQLLVEAYYGCKFLRDSVSCVDDRWSVVLEIILPDVGGATMAQVGNKNLLAIVRITK